MNIRKFALILLSVALVASCKNKNSSVTTRNEFSKAEAAYCTNDIKGAENALINYLQLLSIEQRRQMKGIDYDSARAMTHYRLFLIYRKSQETNKMKSEFEQSIEYMRSNSQRLGQPAPKLTYDSLATTVERLDQGLDVRWKKE